jgi:hypothetical protein
MAGAGGESGSGAGFLIKIRIYLLNLQRIFSKVLRFERKTEKVTISRYRLLIRKTEEWVTGAARCDGHGANLESIETINPFQFHDKINHT